MNTSTEMLKEQDLKKKMKSHMRVLKKFSFRLHTESPR